MADVFYNVGKVAAASGQFDWTASGWYGQLVGPGYIPNGSTDTTPEVFAPYVVGSPVALSAQSVTSSGALSAATFVAPGIESDIAVQALVIYFNDGEHVFLCFYMDTGTGLPLVTTGSNVSLDFNNTPGVGLLYQF